MSVSTCVRFASAPALVAVMALSGYIKRLGTQ